MTASLELVWTDEDSAELDRYAEQFGHERARLRPEVKLWHALAEDREQHPYPALPVSDRRVSIRRSARCFTCNRTFCGRYEKPKDRPGTVEHYGRGYCVACHRKLFRRVEPNFGQCDTCGCTLRGRKTLYDEAPGTRQAHSNTECASCWQRRTRENKKKK